MNTRTHNQTEHADRTEMSTMNRESLCVADTCKELAVLTRKSGFERLGCILEIAETEVRNALPAATADNVASTKQRIRRASSAA
jgi:hypothetical protein